jgi:hypothetical protein
LPGRLDRGVLRSRNRTGFVRGRWPQRAEGTAVGAGVARRRHADRAVGGACSRHQCGQRCGVQTTQRRWRATAPVRVTPSASASRLGGSGRGSRRSNVSCSRMLPARSSRCTRNSVSLPCTDGPSSGASMFRRDGRLASSCSKPSSPRIWGTSCMTPAARESPSTTCWMPWQSAGRPAARSVAPPSGFPMLRIATRSVWTVASTSEVQHPKARLGRSPDRATLDLRPAPAGPRRRCR